VWLESNIAFWNVENLFERRNDPNRPPELQSRLAGELQSWTAAVRDPGARERLSLGPTVEPHVAAHAG